MTTEERRQSSVDERTAGKGLAAKSLLGDSAIWEDVVTRLSAGQRCPSHCPLRRRLNNPSAGCHSAGLKPCGKSWQYVPTPATS